MENKPQSNSKVFKAFGDENRLMLLEALQSGEKCACILLENLNITKRKLSHHLKRLIDGGVVVARREGNQMYFSINPNPCDFAVLLLRTLDAVKDSETDTGNEEG